MANRHPKVISKNTDQEVYNDHWLSEIQKKILEKEAVQPASIDKSLFDKIDSIMNSKPKYTSVDAAVKDMQERSGLLSFLNKRSNTEEESKIVAEKVASDNNFSKDKKLPVLFIKCPNIKKTFENVIKSSKGNLSIPSIIDKVRSIHHNDVSDAKDWDDDNIYRFVSKLNLSAKADNPNVYENYNNLGCKDEMSNTDLEKSNNDIFESLNPTKF